MKRIVIAVLGLFFVTGCVKKLNVAGQRATQPGLISTWMTWVKDKGDKFDAEWNVMNEGQQTLIIMSDDVQCSRGSAPGRITNGPFARSNVAVSLRPGQKKTFLVLCNLTGGSSGGDYRITVANIYNEDPNSGLKNQVVAQNVDLVLGSDGSLRTGAGPAPAPLAKEGSSSGGSSGSSGSFTDGLNSAFSLKSGTGVGKSSSPPPPPAQTAPPPPTQTAPPPPVQTAPPPAVATNSFGRRVWPAAVKHPDWVIAIMDVEDVNAHARDKAIDKDLVRNIGDQLRIFVAERGVATVDRSAQEAAFKESIDRMKSESYGACYDDSCQVELGKALAATHILRSKITRFGSKCVLNGELVDLRAEVAVGAASSRGDCVAEGFLNMSEEVAVSITAH